MKRTLRYITTTIAACILLSSTGSAQTVQNTQTTQTEQTAQMAQPYKAYLEEIGYQKFILISKDELTLKLIDKDGALIKEYGISCSKYYGNKEKRGDNKTPEGTFKINQLLNARGLSHDFGDGKGKIPNAYGPWFLRLNVPGFNDIGIHGTHLPESIGTRATEGCIRLKNEDIIDLKGRVALGTPVIILPDKVQ